MAQPVVVTRNPRDTRSLIALVLLVLAVICFVIYGLIGRATLDWKPAGEYLGFGLAFLTGAFIADRARW